METKTEEIKNLKVGSYVLLEGEACRVTNIQRSAPGKHGHPKIRLEGVGIFDNQKRVIVKPAHERMTVPIIDKRGGQVIAIMGDRVQIMDLSDYNTFETSIPDELKGKLTEGDQVVYWKFGERCLLKGKK